MPVPMVTCALCGKQVTKRSTLALDVLGAGDGRACRDHQEVRVLAEDLARTAQLKRDMAATDRALRVMAAAAGIRVLSTLTGFSTQALYGRLQMAGYSQGMLDEIRKEVERRGGPIMKPCEIGDMALDLLVLTSRKT